MSCPVQAFVMHESCREDMLVDQATIEDFVTQLGVALYVLELPGCEASIFKRDVLGDRALAHVVKQVRDRRQSIITESWPSSYESAEANLATRRL